MGPILPVGVGRGALDETRVVFVRWIRLGPTRDSPLRTEKKLIRDDPPTY